MNQRQIISEIKKLGFKHQKPTKRTDTLEHGFKSDKNNIIFKIHSNGYIRLCEDNYFRYPINKVLKNNVGIRTLYKRELILNKKDRLQFLLNFLLKNKKYTNKLNS